MEEFFPEVVRQWLGDQRTQSDGSVDRATQQAASICGTSQAASRNAQAQEPISRKERSLFNASVKPLEERALESWAKENGLWVPESDFFARYEGRKIGQGAEQQVYLHPNGKQVIKANSGTYHGNWLEFFNRLVCHALFFPSTKYTTIGFTSLGGEFPVIIQQQFAILSTGAHRSVVEAYLNQSDFIRIKNDDYYNASMGVILEDLHDENVFLLDGQLLFIDPVIYFETNEMSLEKRVLFRFPFN